MIYKNDWHVLGIIGDMKETTSVVGSESDCRMISKLMVSSGQWGDAWMYPPGSNSDDMVTRKGNPYEVYTVPTLGGTRGTESHSIKWMGWEHHIFDE
jgi:hypothetical protein